MKEDHGQQLARGLSYGRWIILLQILIILILCFKFRLTTQIERDVLTSKIRGERTEQRTIEIIQQAVTRWEKLQRDNPAMKVPDVSPHP